MLLLFDNDKIGYTHALCVCCSFDSEHLFCFPHSEKMVEV